MIDAKEIRIGNWVRTYKGNMQITEQMFADILCGGWRDNEPIPLTPEILEKAGFKEYKDIKNNQHANNGLAYCFGHADYNYVLKRMWHKEPNYSVCIEYTDSPFIKDKDRQYVFTFDVKYLHQLQNLFYALTQTELNIQL